MNMDMQHQAHREPPSFIFTRSTRIWELLAGDMAAAAVSATLVAPTVTIIDRSVKTILLSLRTDVDMYPAEQLLRRLHLTNRCYEVCAIKPGL